MQETNTQPVEKSAQVTHKTQKSLHDVIVQKFGSASNPGNPFLATIFLCGEKNEEESISTALKTLLDESFMKADAVNPFIKDSESSHAAGLVIDYGKYIIQLIQGPDHNIYSYLTNLRSAKNLTSKNFVLFFDDDTTKIGVKDWVQIDKVPPRALEEDHVLEKSDEEISDSVLTDFFNLLELGAKCIEQGANQKASFSDIARVNFPKLYPSINSLEMYKRSNLFLTLGEFVDNLCVFPQLTRDCEINHPLENPLMY
ncbi:unnamed protein product [Phytomonas sp. EM1]|nr:unnamed protein product [Phytomonas sp. EM1]|eukprot:CCW62599.1 unnamed protein product [Phytomonas sp. isolate EM1]